MSGHGDGPYALWYSSGCIYFHESIESCITVTVTLFLSSTTPSSASLLPIPLALSCRTLKVLSSLICSTGGAGVAVGKGGDCWGFVRKSTYFHLRNIGGICSILSNDSCAQLIHSLVTVRLDYCNSIMYGLPDNSLYRLQKIQNTAARI